MSHALLCEVRARIVQRSRARSRGELREGGAKAARAFSCGRAREGSRECHTQKARTSGEQSYKQSHEPSYGQSREQSRD
eukprot:15455620-Alexandrium_andersonii.AAC.1